MVIFSISLVTYIAIADWGGMSILAEVFGTQPERPSFLYFFGVALVAFSLRRIADQRSERAKRLAAELKLASRFDDLRALVAVHAKAHPEDPELARYREFGPRRRLPTRS